MTKALPACLMVTVFLAGSTALASDQNKGFPNRRVTVVVPIGAGGGGDAVARTITLD